MTATIKGDQMYGKLQQDAKRKFVHRYTRDHVPAWAMVPMPNGKAYPVQFDSDAEWLANTTFTVTKKGELAKRNPCHSVPTWPDNPELRTA